jgi:flagellar basal-body rod protein FlgB
MQNVTFRQQSLAPEPSGSLMMVSANLELMDLLIKKMSYLNKVQTVHAENVANANTPGYKALDVAPFTFGDALKEANLGMSVTNARHIVPASMKGANEVAVKPKYNSDSDAGDIEQESTKVAETGSQFTLMTSVYRKITGLFKIAIKGGA